MQAAFRSYVTSGIAIVGASVIAVTPIAATPRDIQIANPAVQLTASPFDEYEALLTESLGNIQGLIEQALAPPPPPSELPFTLDSLITGLLDVDANIAAFQSQVSGLPQQVNSLEELTQMLLQAASARLQAGNVEDALDIVLYTALFTGTGVAGFALYPLTLLGPDVQELAPSLFGAAINAAVAPVLAGVAASGEVVQDVLDALASDNPQEILGHLIAAPAVVTNGVLNGANLQTSIFGTVAIPGILTDTTLLDQEGPGPIALAIQLGQLARALLTPPAAAASSLSTTQDTARVRTFNLNLNKDLDQEVAPVGASAQSGTVKPTATADLKADDTRNVLDTGKVTNAAASNSTDGKNDHPRVFGGTSGSPVSGGQDGKQLRAGMRDGIHDGVQGFRESVRNVVKAPTGRGHRDDGADSPTGSDETG
jgi:hypothetical protein